MSGIPVPPKTPKSAAEIAAEKLEKAAEDIKAATEAQKKAAEQALEDQKKPQNNCVEIK